MNELEALLQNEDYGAAESNEKHPFLEVRYLDDGPDPTRRYRVEQALAGKPVRLASTKFEPREQSSDSARAAGEETLGDLQSLDPLEVLLAAYHERYEGAEPEPAVLAAFKEILSEVNE
jgi:exonuclease SbcD